MYSQPNKIKQKLEQFWPKIQGEFKFINEEKYLKHRNYTENFNPYSTLHLTKWQFKSVTAST